MLEHPSGLNVNHGFLVRGRQESQSQRRRGDDRSKRQSAPC